jgi:hypothetical protein
VDAGRYGVLRSQDGDRGRRRCAPGHVVADGRDAERRGAGFAIGAFFSLMSASFAYEDPLTRQTTTTKRAREIFREMGQGMYTSGRGFGKVGALFASIECVIESVRIPALSFPLRSLPHRVRSTAAKTTW